MSPEERAKELCRWACLRNGPSEQEIADAIRAAESDAYLWGVEEGIAHVALFLERNGELNGALVARKFNTYAKEFVPQAGVATCRKDSSK